MTRATARTADELALLGRDALANGRDEKEGLRVARSVRSAPRHNRADVTMSRARKPEISADAAYAIFTRPSRECTGS
jgi:hypothetical protein